MAKPKYYGGRGSSKGSLRGMTDQRLAGEKSRLEARYEKVLSRMRSLENDMLEEQYNPGSKQVARPKWNKADDEAQQIRSQISKIEDEQDRRYRNSSEYKEATREAENIRRDRARVRQRERKVTSTTYENAQRRLNRNVNSWFKRSR